MCRRSPSDRSLATRLRDARSTPAQARHFAIGRYPAAVANEVPIREAQQRHISGLVSVPAHTQPRTAYDWGTTLTFWDPLVHAIALVGGAAGVEARVKDIKRTKAVDAAASGDECG